MGYTRDDLCLFFGACNQVHRFKLQATHCASKLLAASQDFQTISFSQASSQILIVAVIFFAHFHPPLLLPDKAMDPRNVLLPWHPLVNSPSAHPAFPWSPSVYPRARLACSQGRLGPRVRYPPNVTQAFLRVKTKREIIIQLEAFLTKSSPGSEFNQLVRTGKRIVG